MMQPQSLQRQNTSMKNPLVLSLLVLLSLSSSSPPLCQGFVPSKVPLSKNQNSMSNSVSTQQFSSPKDTADEKENSKRDSLLFDDYSTTATSTSTTTTTTTSETKTTKVSSDLFMTNGDSSSSSTTTTLSSSGFGQSVSINARPTTAATAATTTTTTTTTADVCLVTKEKQVAEELRERNVAVALLSIFFAIASYVWQYTHPIQPIQILFEMQQHSASPAVIGKNGKPTVVDFWAPWCENCKVAAPTLKLLEEEYADKVNFVMINGDLQESWPYIEAFGVDAIPHLAMVSATGEVETALIGPLPKKVLKADIDTMLQNAEGSKKQFGKQQQPKKELPYQMLDAFAGKSPEERKVQFDK